jgi:hypothetical protein
VRNASDSQYYVALLELLKGAPDLERVLGAGVEVEG